MGWNANCQGLGGHGRGAQWAQNVSFATWRGLQPCEWIYYHRPVYLKVITITFLLCVFYHAPLAPLILHMCSFNGALLTLPTLSLCTLGGFLSLGFVFLQ